MKFFSTVNKFQTKKGLTSTEVLVSLAVVAIFMFIAHQMYLLVMERSTEARFKAKAGNIAYSHLRSVGDSISMSDCSDTITRKTLTPREDEKLPNIEINAMLSAPYKCASRLIKIEVNVKYNLNGSSRQETQAIYVQK